MLEGWGGGRVEGEKIETSQLLIPEQAELASLGRHD